MSAAARVATAAADRVIDEDAAIEAIAIPPSLTDDLVEMLASAARTDGVSDDEAIAFARDARESAAFHWLAGPAGRAAFRAAQAHAARTRGIGGISAHEVRALERVTRATVARRFAERDSPRAEGDDTQSAGASRADEGKAGAGA